MMTVCLLGYSFVPSVNGNELVSCSRDKTIKVWDTASGYDMDAALPALARLWSCCWFAWLVYAATVFAHSKGTRLGFAVFESALTAFT